MIIVLHVNRILLAQTLMSVIIDHTLRQIFFGGRREIQGGKEIQGGGGNPRVRSSLLCINTCTVAILVYSRTTNHHAFGVEIHAFIALHASTHASQFVHASEEVSKNTYYWLLRVSAPNC